MSPPFELHPNCAGLRWCHDRYGTEAFGFIDGTWLWVAPTKSKGKRIINENGYLYLYSIMLHYILLICLVQLTRLFWPNTCLVSMCISGASGAASKQV